MAQYQHLPIYKTTYELLRLVTEFTRGFPKDFRYTLGPKLRDECVDLVLLIYRANSTRSRRAVIELVLERLQVVVRYVDDMIVLSTNPKELAPAAASIDSLLGSCLRCRLHPKKTQIMPMKNGVPFLGFIVRPHARYVKRETQRSAANVLRGKCRARADPKDIQAAANSYLGLLRQSSGWRARGRLAAILRSYGHLVSPKLTRMFA